MNTGSPRPRFATALAVATLLSIGLAGCATGTADPSDNPAVSATGDPGAGGAADGPRPAWYGDSFDARGCPAPPSGAPLAVFDDAESLLGVPLPDGWCIYMSVDYTQFYIIPATSDPDFAADARAVLEPAGWAFDPADDDSPHWSWITAYPESALDLGFTDADIDGSIFFTTAMTEDEGSSRHLWYDALIKTFADFEPGGYAAVLGFW